MDKIGYQGIEGCNSEEAALLFIKDNNIEDYELVPLINSKNVIENLENRIIDYGVMATYNSTAGVVLETKNALENKEDMFDTVYECSINIHHALFKKKDVNEEDLKYVASHPQALKQTKGNRNKLYPNLKEIEVEDTALAAKYLYENKLGNDTAVICKKKAGEIYNLELVKENLEDLDNNKTDFFVLKRRGE